MAASTALRAALAYHRTSVPFVLAPWIDELFGAATPAIGDRVLDLACGTGLVAQHAATFVGPRGRVVGLDLDASRLAVARRVRPASSALRWRQADAARLPFRAASFDLAYCNQGLQFMPDPEGVLRGLRRVLRPGARVVAAVWGRMEVNPYFAAVASALGRSFGASTRRASEQAFALGAPGRLAELLHGAGFDAVTARQVARPVVLPVLERFLPLQLAGGAAALDWALAAPEVRARLVADVLEALAPVPGAPPPPVLRFEVHIASAVA